MNHANTVARGKRTQCTILVHAKWVCPYNAVYRVAGTNGVGNEHPCGSHVSVAIDTCLDAGADVVSVARLAG